MADWWEDAPIAKKDAPAAGGDQWWSAAPVAGGGQQQPTMSRLDRFGAGLLDLPVGAAQAVAHIAPSFLVSDDTTKQVDEAVRKREARIAAERGPDAGFDWWRLAGNAANPVNYLPVGRAIEGAGLLARAGRAAAQGAAVGAAQPAALPNTDFWTEKGIQTAFGAAGGAAVEPVVAGMGAGARAAAQWLFGTKGAEALKDKATAAILKRIDQSGATAQDMLDLLAQAPGKPLALADVGGENLQGMVGKIYREPGEARDIIGNAMRQRDLDAGLRLSGDIGTALGNRSAFQTFEALKQARSVAAKPLFEKAYEMGPVYSDRIAEFLTNPRIQQGIQHGLRIERDSAMAAGRPMNPADYAIVGFNEAGDPVIGGVPTMRLLAVAKEGLDRLLQSDSLRNPLTGALNKEGVAVDQLRGAFVDELDRVNPAYRAARAQWGGDSASMQALRDGEAFMRKSPEVIADMVSKMGPNEKEFFKLGVAARLRDTVAKTGASGDEARRIVGNAYTRGQLRPLFDSPQDYDRFIDAVRAETTMFQTKGNVMGGSQTAARVAEDQGTDIHGLTHVARSGIETLRGNPLSGLYSAARALGRFLPRTDPKLAAEIARQTTDPREAARVLGVMQSRPTAAAIPTEQQVAPWLAPAAALGVQPVR